MIWKVTIMALFLGTHVRLCLEHWQTGGLVSGPTSTEPAFVCSPEVAGGSSLALPRGSSNRTLTGLSSLRKNKKLRMGQKALSGGRQSADPHNSNRRKSFLGIQRPSTQCARHTTVLQKPAGTRADLMFKTSI